MDRYQIAQVLEEIAALLEIKGDNPFKIRAYENAARIVEGLTNLDELIEKNKLTSVKGIGKNLAEHIKELYETGNIKEYKKMLESVPPGIIEMLAIPGVGAKKIKLFWEKLDITTVGELEYACQENRLRDLPGFGEKSQQKVLQGIQFYKKHQGKHLYSYALPTALSLLKMLRENSEIKQVEIAGSLRRKKEIVKDIDIVASTDNLENVMQFFLKLDVVDEIIAEGNTKTSVTLKNGLNADLRCVKTDEFPYALHHFTGSKEHNTQMRRRSKELGYKMNEYGLFKNGKNIKCRSEEEIFKELKLEYIPPELREATGEIEAARAGDLPELISEKDLKGLLHIHSIYSDGSNDIEELAKEAKKKGYAYIGICDHSQSAAYAGGLKPADIKKQHKEIDEINRKIDGITILKGIECDILIDGRLDYTDDILETFDFIIGSVHSRFKLTSDEMTERISNALKNPYLDILGHPTGRLLLGREGYQLDMKKIIGVAASEKKIIELNANPHRLDVDWRLGKYIREKNVKIAICPDAHNTKGFDDAKYGVGIARKGWFEAKDVVNTLSLDNFMNELNRKK